jgi:hypothetical protein
MATHTGGDDIELHPENDNHNYDNIDIPVDNTDGNSTAATGTATTGGAAGGTGSTSFNLRVEQHKILEFFGTKSKDTISAMDFIRQLEDLSKTNQLTNAQTYHHFANSLCNLALMVRL